MIRARYTKFLVCYRKTLLLNILPSPRGQATNISFNMAVMIIDVEIIGPYDFEIMPFLCVGASSKHYLSCISYDIYFYDLIGRLFQNSLFENMMELYTQGKYIVAHLWQNMLSECLLYTGLCKHSHAIYCPTRVHTYVTKTFSIIIWPCRCLKNVYENRGAPIFDKGGVIWLQETYRYRLLAKTVCKTLEHTCSTL